MIEYILIAWLIVGLVNIWFVCDYEQFKLNYAYLGFELIKQRIWPWTMLLMLGPIGFIVIMFAAISFKK